jgi:hypothetical protein
MTKHIYRFPRVKRTTDEQLLDLIIEEQLAKVELIWTTRAGETYTYMN